MILLFFKLRFYMHCKCLSLPIAKKFDSGLLGCLSFQLANTNQIENWLGFFELAKSTQ
jgi:hypothetical protein